MATRTLESRKDRLMTMLIIPFMSCSARLPVYVLLISAFFPSNQGLVLFSIYLIGILIAIGSSILFKKLLFAKAEAPFVMELPPYRIPTTRNVVRHMWSKGSQYLRKMGTVILTASIIIWALGYYPRNVEYSVDYDRVAAEIASSGLSPEDEQAKLQELNDIRHAEHQKQSYIGKIGRFIEPAIRPLGFDWQIGISLFSGLAAKEIVVSTLPQVLHGNRLATGGIIGDCHDDERNFVLILLQGCFQFCRIDIAFERHFQLGVFRLIYSTIERYGFTALYMPLCRIKMRVARDNISVMHQMTEKNILCGS